MKMNLHRAEELIEPLRKGTAEGISEAWRWRLIEALEYVIEHATKGVECPMSPDQRHHYHQDTEGFSVVFDCTYCGKRQ